MNTPVRPGILVVPAALVLTACLPQFGGKLNSLKSKNAERLATNDDGEIRGLCLKPEVRKEPYYLDWTDSASTKKACAWLKEKHAADLATTETEARQIGGIGCLERVADEFRRMEHEPEWRMPYETPEARRAALSTIAEPCVLQVELMGSVSGDELFLLLLGHEAALSAASLTDDQRARLLPLTTKLPANAAKSFESHADLVSESYPLAASLYFASAAIAANAAGDSAARDDLVERAMALVTQAGPVKLSVTLTGDLAQGIKKSASAYNFVEQGEFRLGVKLRPPTMVFGEREVVMSATHRVEAGTKPNPDYRSAKGECDSLETQAVSREESCARSRVSHPEEENGFGGSCIWSKTFRERADKCSSGLARMQQEVPAFTEESIAYDATEFFGSSKGTLELTVPGKPTELIPIAGTVTSLRHDTVPVVNLSAQHGGAVSPAEVTADYEATAASKITALLQAASSRLSETLLSRAAAAEDEESAESMVRYTLKTSATPESEMLQSQDAKLKLPSERALKVLLAKQSGNQVSW